MCFFGVSCNSITTPQTTNETTVKPPLFHYEYSESANGYILVKYTGRENKVIIPELYNEEPVRSIAAEVFSNNPFIQEVYIPSNVQEIGEKCFFDCSNLTSVVITNEDNITIGSSCFMDCSKLVSIEIYGNLSTLSDRVFSRCSSLPNIILPDTLLAIGDGAFSGCSSLQSISIPDNVQTIGESAFSGCSMIESVIIPESCSSISNNTFSNCSALLSVYIPASTIDISRYAFSSTPSLQEINVDENNPQYLSIDGMLIDRETQELIFYPSGKKETVLVIPEFVTTICEYAFSGENNLRELTLHENIIEIKNRGGTGCTQLEKLYILSHDVVIHPNAFYRGGIGYINGVETSRTPYTYPFVIYCFENSTAVPYAINNDIVFKLIDR